MLDEQPAATPTRRPTVLASSNLALKFALELGALALLTHWGAVTGAGAWAVVLAIAAPAVMIGLWARWAAPRSRHRLSAPARVPVELGLFALATAAGCASGAVVPAIAFAAVALVNALGLTLLRQWQ